MRLVPTGLHRVDFEHEVPELTSVDQRDTAGRSVGWLVVAVGMQHEFTGAFESKAVRVAVLERDGGLAAQPVRASAAHATRGR